MKEANGLDIFFLDTSALLRDVDILNKLPTGKVVIHSIVLEELNTLSDKGGSKGSLARNAIDKLFELRNRGNFYNGIKWNNKVVEFIDIEPDTDTYLRFGLTSDCTDNLLLCVAREVKQTTGSKVTIITADKGFTLKAGMDLSVMYVGKNKKKAKNHKNKGYLNGNVGR